MTAYVSYSPAGNSGFESCKTDRNSTCEQPLVLREGANTNAGNAGHDTTASESHLMKQTQNIYSVKQRFVGFPLQATEN